MKLMKHHRNHTPASSELPTIEASAARLELAGLDPAQAYAFAVIVRRMQERDFDDASARDQLRRAGFPARASDAMMSEIEAWRRSVRLPTAEQVERATLCGARRLHGTTRGQIGHRNRKSRAGT
jgi:hypothetical protein